MKVTVPGLRVAIANSSDSFRDLRRRVKADQILIDLVGITKVGAKRGLSVKKRRNTRVLMLLENSHYPQDPRVRRESKDLLAAGYQVSVICPANPGQPRREIVEGVRVYRYPVPWVLNGPMGYLWEYSYSMAATLLTSLAVFWREGFDIIHAANPPDTFALIAAPFRLLGKRFVYDHHDLAPEMYLARFSGKGNRFLHWMLVALEKLSYRLADHVIVTNESYRLHSLRRGVGDEKITIVRNGPDLDRLSRTEPNQDLRKMSPMIVGYMGVTGFQDGVDCLLRAIHRLVHELGRPDFLCAVVGDGDALPALRSLAQQLRITEHVLFTGWVQLKEVGQYINAMDICVAPEPSNLYNDQSTAIKIMEYMAAGKPIVAFDLPEHRYSAQGAAIYARPNDELELARAIALLMDDPARREAMGSLGRRRVETELAWQYSTPYLLDAYERVEGKPKQGAVEKARRQLAVGSDRRK